MAKAALARDALIRKQFGRVSAIAPCPDDGRAVIGRCSCGDERRYFAANLKRQSEPMCPSCRERARPSKGQSGKHPLFNIWKAMIQRCENPNHTWFARYGGRGIRMCDRWREDFTAFAADVGERPSPRHTIDRIKGEQGYEPGNVRWALPIQQQRNRSDTLRIEWRGRIISGKEAADLAGLEIATFYYRLKAGWPIERIMTTPSTMTANKGVPKPKKCLS